MERTVEGVFSRAFRSKIKPIELGRRLVREMDDRRTLDVKGRALVPNMYSFALSPGDYEAFIDIREPLIRELVEAAHQHASDERYGFMGPVTIELKAEPSLTLGRFNCVSRILDASDIPVNAVLVAPDGQRINIGSAPTLIGRLLDCAIPIDDTNVSRRHAEIRLVEGRHQITDLHSTNGTMVNGVPVSSEALTFGDLITIGAVTLRYEAT